ncbi:hypothetical protein [Persicitalea sp.]|uniref:hypothetical protein n=1 Tax=Persicitalea sp. TaxID=3100273 RepID=UPI0035938A91
MLIANPIYDVVFKRLMEDERIAKFFIGTLLDEIIEEVQVMPQEFTYTDQLAGLAVFRVDFIATIKTQEGIFRKVLIEIQKAKNLIDLMRFRNYLAEQYKKEDEVETATGKQKTALPIVTIYLLGFNLPEVETPAVRVQRQYKDLIANRIIEKKSEFIEKLTHDCFVIQLPRIDAKYQTRLDKLLSIFEQAHFVDEAKTTKLFNHETDIEEVKIMTDLLHYTGTDPAEKKKIEIEQEAWRSVEAMLEESNARTEKLQSKLSEAESKLSEAAKEIEELKRRLGER